MSNPFDLPSIDTPEDEEQRERDFWSFETECVQFAQRYGIAAALRALARAIAEQKDLLPR